MRKHWLHRFKVICLKPWSGGTPGVFGKGVSMWAGGQEMAIMARDIKTLQEMFDKLKENPDSKLDTSLVYDVVYLQSQNVTLEDEEL